jgi:endothelin-converting enzyme/putative endopeptidase
VQQLVANLVAVFPARIDALDWMAPSTRAHAREKLRSLTIGVGYPDKWKSYAGLVVRPDDAYGNALRGELFVYKQALAKLRRKPDNGEWAMPAHLVNAANLPLQNALNFPAAHLQPPFFDPDADDASHNCAIGASIGHEISHSFDDQGAQFDAQGRLRDWWTAADKARFNDAAARLVAQFSAYRPFPDMALNGQLTLSENLADQAGVTAALDALHALPGQQASAATDARFFTAYARLWRIKVREAAQRQRVLTDYHAPAEYRSAIVRNLDAWYPAFDVQPGQALYLPPQQRVKVW